MDPNETKPVPSRSNTSPKASPQPNDSLEDLPIPSDFNPEQEMGVEETAAKVSGREEAVAPLKPRLNRQNQAHQYTTRDLIGLPRTVTTERSEPGVRYIGAEEPGKSSRVLKPMPTLAEPRDPNWMPYEPNQYYNKKRAAVEAIIQSFQSDAPPAMTYSLKARLQQPLKRWVLRKGIHKRHEKCTGFVQQLKDMNEARKSILDAHQLEDSYTSNQDVLLSSYIHLNQLKTRKKKSKRKASKRKLYRKSDSSYSSDQGTGSSSKQLKYGFNPSFSRSSTPVSDKIKSPKQQTLLATNDSVRHEEQMIQMFGGEFLNFEQIKRHDLATECSCDRIGSYRALLAGPAAFPEQKHGFLWKGLKASETTQRKPLKEAKSIHLHKYFKKSQLPQSQKYKLEHYNNLALPSPFEECEIKSINFEVKQMSQKIIMKTIYATYQELLHSHGHDRFWHSDLLSTFLKNFYAAMEVGYNVPGYPPAPDDYVCQQQAKDINKSYIADTIYFDDGFLPEWFPKTSGFQRIKEKKRTLPVGRINLTTLHQYDFEPFFPFFNQPLTFEGMEAVIQIICDSAHKVYEEDIEDLDDKNEIEDEAGPEVRKEMGYFYHRLDHLHIYNMETIQLIEMKNKIQKMLDSVVSCNYIVMILPFIPSSRFEPIEVLVVLDYVAGEMRVISAEQPSESIREWHPFEGFQQLHEIDEIDPMSLEGQLKTLQSYLQLVLPRDDFDENQDWTPPQSFWRDGSLDGLPKSEIHLNRLVLCKYLEKVTRSKASSSNKLPWIIGTVRPNNFEMKRRQAEPDFNEEKNKLLSRLTSNYTRLPNHAFDSVNQVPATILDDMLNCSVIDSVNNIWHKYRYFELLQLKLSQSNAPSSEKTKQ